MTETSRHLDMDELEDAVRFMLNDGPAAHLARCLGCQNMVEWLRALKDGELLGDERDWLSATLQALALSIAAKGNSLVYAIPSRGVICRLVNMYMVRQRR